MPGQGFTVDDVSLGAMDLTESVIEEIYAKNPPLYAVYRNSDRVAVHYADNEALADRQRTDAAALSVLRSEINSLVGGWRKSSRIGFQARAQRYDGEVAAALIQCLEEGKPDNARTVMQRTRDDVLAERISWGMAEYLISASVAGAIAIGILTIFQHFVWHFDVAADNIWLAARAGIVGAFFSVAGGIRGRTILPNIRRRDNISDAVLRIVIGIIAAAVLLLLLGADMVGNLKIGEAALSGKHISWQVVILIGFLAGFVERLVPGILDKSVGGQAPAPAPTPSAAPALRPLPPPPAPPASLPAPAPPPLPAPAE